MRFLLCGAAVLLVSLGCSTPSAAPRCDDEGQDPETTIRAARLDLLFVVDTSPGMAPHLARLRAEIPRLFASLTLGPRAQAAYGQPGVTRFSDVHLAVVSADLGSGEVAADGCSARGEDGLLRGAPECAEARSRFVWYYKHQHDPAAALDLLECQLGAASSSCRVAQPLEAALKALWPLSDAPGAALPEIGFSGTDASHGDRENLGFLRTWQAHALRVVVVLTNQDDCSLLETPELASDEPAVDQVLRRCREQPERFAALERYLQAFGVDPGGAEQRAAPLQLVLIAGIPPDLVPRDTGRSDLQAQYDAALNDPRMQWRATRDGAGLEPSCAHGDAAAYPPRRLLELAKRSDPERVVVGSLCDADLLEAVWRLWELRTTPQPDVQLEPGEFCGGPRDSAGHVPCTMTWELPTSRDPTRPTAILSCNERPELLSTPSDPNARIGPRGGALCEVRQLALPDPLRELTPDAGEGYYLGLSPTACSGAPHVTYTDRAWPPEGTTVTLHCERAMGKDTLPCDSRYDTRASRSDPELREGAELCDVDRWELGRTLCHPTMHICVRPCRGNGDCPYGWLCDSGSTPLSASAGTSICLKPLCEDD